MATFVIRAGKLIDKDRAPPLIERFGEGPNIISDSMAETRHMADGKYYSSKAKFREITKAHGCIEVGDDSSLGKPRKPKMLDRSKRVSDIKNSIEKLKSQSKRRK